ncbi:MAG: tetratricopeptide repeat protein [Bryobacteraceae bacterium]|nr:tetratricopeptide repeat protein [Bryobacteraceae bacterium]
MIQTTLAIAMSFAMLAAQPPQQGQQSEGVRQAQRLMREGKLDEALAAYKQELKATPNSLPALNGAGVTLDLMGKTSEARGYFSKAIEAAPTPQAKAGAQRAMAMSYAFDNDCKNTVKYEMLVNEHWVAEKNFYQQGEMLNEAARVCIEAGEFDTAERLYRSGTEAGLQEPNISAERKALWAFRLEHALARLAARRGQKEVAQKHVTAAKALLDSNAEMAKAQAVFFPYLAGYVALYTGDPHTARFQLSQANQNDPFINCLLGLAQEQLGDKAKAAEHFKKAYATTGHNPPAAFAKPFARKKLGLK